MMAVFYLDHKSFLIAYLLSRLRGAKAVMYDQSKRYFFDKVEDTRALNYDSIYSDFRDKFGKIDFLEDPKLYEVISNDIFWSLRHRSIDNSRLTMQVLGQIENGGSKKYLAEESAEAREMRFRVRRVLSEFNRALKYVRFDRYDSPALSLSEASFDNDIADMVLRVEAMKYPGNTVAIYDDKNVSLLINGEVFSAKRQRIPLNPTRKDFRIFWRELPKSGESPIKKDELHQIDELPQTALAQAVEMGEKIIGREPVTLDDFA